MSKPLLSTLPLLLCGLASGFGVARIAAAPDVVLKDSEHRKVGSAIQEYQQAREGTHKSRKMTSLDAKDELRKLLGKWSKKKGVDGRDPLSLTEDLGEALWYAHAYDKAKGVKKGKVAEIEVTTGDGREIEYAIWAPSKYRAQTGPYPFILCISDSDETPTEHLQERWVNADIRDGAILAVVPMPEDVADWEGIEVLGNFFRVWQDVTNRYAVDFDRIFVAGRGAGVAAAMNIVSRFPDRFAGVIGRTGDAAEVGPDSFFNAPTFFAGAGKAATEFQKACADAGHDNVTLEPAGQEAEVWAWVQGHARDGNPTRITLRPGKPFPTSAYWLKVPATDTDALITAEVDRATNTITIDAKGVTEVTLSYNDVLLDLDRPVKVICNGVEHEDTVPRNLDTFLERVLLTSNDPGKLYTAFHTYDVPAVEESEDSGDSGVEEEK